MTTSTALRTAAVTAALLATAAITAASPPLPETPAPIAELLYARPFTVADSFEFEWYPSLGAVTTGTLAVVRADPALIFPRQSAMPILYAGDIMAFRFSPPSASGVFVALIPGDVDLATQPMWFGPPDLPERVDHKRVTAELAAARAAGIGPFPTATLRAALDAGGPELAAAGLTDLATEARRLTERYVGETQP